MDDRLARVKADFLRASALPFAWYAYFATAVAVVMVVLSISGHPNLAAVTLSIALLPAVILQILVTAYIPLRDSIARTALPRIAIWCGRLMWSGLTFALGAFVATLMAIDLENVDSGSTANQYLYQFLVLVLVCVALVAAMGGLIASAWIYLFSDAPTRSRAALRALTTSSSRDELPLRVRMWLDSHDRAAMPNLGSRVRTDHLIRVITTELAGIILLAMSLLLVGMILLIAPVVIDWVA